MSDTYPSVDESRDRLQRADWSLGEVSFGSAWKVDCSNGENRLLAMGGSQAEAWYRATVQARERGMLAPPLSDEQEGEGEWLAQRGRGR